MTSRRNRGLVRNIMLGALRALLVCALVGSTVSPGTARAATLTSVTLSPNTPGVVNQYTVRATFTTPVTGGSTLTVTFDTQTTVPSTVTSYPAWVTVNGVPANSVSVYSQQMFITTSALMPPATDVTIGVSTAVGIIPQSMGQHSITLACGAESVPGTYLVGTTGTAVTLQSVMLGDPGFGNPSSYDFTFTTTLPLNIGDSISVKFPAAFHVPEAVSGKWFSLVQNNSRIGSFKQNAAISGTTVTLKIPGADPADGDNFYQFSAGIPMTLHCALGSGISNPTVGGEYQFQLWTSLQPTPATRSVTLGSSVGSLSVVATPAVAGSVAAYRVSFSTSSTGALATGTGKITLAFPAGFTLPATVPMGAVKVNGVAASAVIAGQNLVITVPLPIAAGGPVSLDISTEAGIRTGTAGSYQLSATTSVDQLSVKSNLFTISASTISSVAVSVVPAVKGATASLTATFTTGVGGALGAGDTVSLFLPYGFMVPSTIDRTQVVIKTPATAATGLQPASVVTSPSAQSVVLALPSGSAVAAGASVAVTLPPVITNPAVGGTFTAKVSTSKETTAVDSQAFTVFNNPVSTLTLAPAAPDGKNNTYVTQPSFVLSVDGPAGTTLSAFYKLDDATTFTTFDLKTAAAVKVPDGKHTIAYYAQDNLGNVEPVRSQQVSVDLADPVIAVSSPAEGGVVVQPAVSILGRVTAKDLSGLQLTAGGRVVPVSADGAFAAPVTFDHEGVNTVELVATSASGRTGRLTLSVNYIARVTMSLVIGSPTVNLNNEFKTLEAAPFISKKGVTMVPLRFISEAFKANVAWDPVFKSVTITLGGKTMRIQVGYMTADVNGKSFALQDAPVIVKGRTFVPLRFIAENFGAQVDWNSQLKMVSIIYPKP